MKIMRAVTVLAACAAVGLSGGAALGHWQNRTITYGNMDAAPYWGLQHYQDCAPMAAAAIIGAETHRTLNEATITSIALEFGYTNDGGTPMQAIPQLFAEYGLTATVEAGLNVEQLEDILRHGHRIMLVLNGHTLWTAAGVADAGTDVTTANHAVVLDEIKGDTVHITDSGTMPDEQVTVPELVSAWAPEGAWVVVVA